MLLDLLVLFTDNHLYCDQREIWSRRKFETSGLTSGTCLGTSGWNFRVELLKLVEELPELVDPRMIVKMTSQPQNY
jgi:hypothetical protein